MSNKPLLEDGPYLCVVDTCQFRETSDGVKFIELMIVIEYTVKLHYRLPLTKGAFNKTFDSLVVMGATMKVNPETNEVDDIFDGIGSKEFYANCVSLECHENEAPGKYRTYISSVEST